jgi:peptidoglycan hydrolase CwlO-like protein
VTVQDPIGAAQEPVVTVQDYISEVQEPVPEIQRRVPEIQRHVPEIQRCVVEVQPHTRELISGELDKNCNVESLRNIVGYIEGLEQEIKILKSNKKNGNKKSAGDEVDKLTSAFYSLAKVLKSFKNCTSEQRKKVKNRINAQDFGYVTSFMKAMYDEQSFADFVFFADYELKGDEK